MRNRQDRLVPGPNRLGVACDWEFTRTLHLCDLFPRTARRLLFRALRDWPIGFADTPDRFTSACVCANTADIHRDARPEVSFIIGHRGLDRLPHLLFVLKTIGAQQEIRFECIVVEQDVSPQVRENLPGWVRYVHTPAPSVEMPYCRSWAFNVGAGMARGRLLLFHDNDMLIPTRYAATAWQLFRKGYEILNLKRFIFYRSRVEREADNPLDPDMRWAVDCVVENLDAGGSVAVAKDAFEAIGGFDEHFVGWGGEDNEFWDRCLTRKVWRNAFLPMVHLWHAAQAGKRAVNGMGMNTATLTLQRRAMGPMERIRELNVRPRGALSWVDCEKPPENKGKT